MYMSIWQYLMREARDEKDFITHCRGRMGTVLCVFIRSSSNLHSRRLNLKVQIKENQ